MYIFIRRLFGQLCKSKIFMSGTGQPITRSHRQCTPAVVSAYRIWFVGVVGRLMIFGPADRDRTVRRNHRAALRARLEQPSLLEIVDESGDRIPKSSNPAAARRAAFRKDFRSAETNSEQLIGLEGEDCDAARSVKSSGDTKEFHSRRSGGACAPSSQTRFDVPPDDSQLRRDVDLIISEFMYDEIRAGRSALGASRFIESTYRDALIVSLSHHRNPKRIRRALRALLSAANLPTIH